MAESRIQTEYISQFGRGLWRYVRSSFYTAGQDSFADPPSQNEDMFEQLLNVMPPVQGDLDRRWGYKLFNGSIPDGAPTTRIVAEPFNLWTDITSTNRLLFVNGPQGQYAVDEQGVYSGIHLSSLYSTVRSITTRGFLYSANGAQVPQKWTQSFGPTTTNNWGTDVSNVTGLSAGPLLPGTAVSGAGFGGVPWTNINNVKLEDAVFTQVQLDNQQSEFILASNFGFAMSATAIVVGVQVQIKGFRTIVTGSPVVRVFLTNVGSFGTTKVVPGNAFPVTNGNLILGGPTDMWGQAPGTITGAFFNSSGFTVNLRVDSTGSHSNWAFDVIKVTVFTEPSPIALGAPTGGGAITLVNGRKYTTTFYSSVTNTFSDLGPFSLSTGPLTTQNQPLTGIAVSADPQIDRKKILATADGGDEETLYEIGDLANATTSLTDTTPEAVLLLNNQWQAVLIDGTSVGVADNTPPNNAMNYPILHRGRVYGLVQNNLVYSKSNDELITPTNVIAGNYEECFPGLNFFPLTSTGEQGRGLLSDGTVLYIGTDRRVVRLFGDGPATFLQPQVLFDNVGIMSQDVWKMILLEGNPVGAMWLTPDLRVLGSDFNTYQDVGTPIQNILDSINGDAAQLTAWAANVNISVFNLYILAVPTGANLQPDTLLVFDLKGKKWYEWQLTDTAVGGFWWVALGGTPQFVIQAATGKLYLFDPTLLDDRVGDFPQPFTASARTSWLNLGDGTAYKNLNEIEISTRDIAGGFSLTVEGASSIQDFLSPRAVVTNAPLVQKPRGTYGVFLAGASTRDRWYRFTFNFADDQTDLLRSFNIQGSVLNRL